MQSVLLLGVKLAEVYSGKTHISLPILCLFLPLPRLFFFFWQPVLWLGYKLSSGY